MKMDVKNSLKVQPNWYKEKKHGKGTKMIHRKEKKGIVDI